MASRSGTSNIWDEIAESDEIAVIYRRKKVVERSSRKSSAQSKEASFGNENRVSWVPVKRISLNRALSTRGRTSIAVAAFADQRPQQRNQKGKQKPPRPRGKTVQPSNFDKEREYFREVDSFELLEESPSPKQSGTWAMGVKSDKIVVSHLSSVLQNWLLKRRLNHSYGPSRSLSNILGTPALLNGVPGDDVSSLSTPEKASAQIFSNIHPIQERFSSSFTGIDVYEKCIPPRKNSEVHQNMGMEGCEDIEVAVRNLSLASRPSLNGHLRESFLALLTVCGQSDPSTLFDVFSTYCDPETIAKVGEGTFGEAFKAGKTVCKIVPFDGDLRVNGEVQKRAEELFEEVILSLSLNRLRGHEGDTCNTCTTFIETIDVKVCQGPYDGALIRAWEHWDTKHGSENDHPNEFQENQCYVVFVQEHGGQDLESFVLQTFDEARSLLVQVTVALAVAEAAYEFEHRDLHWGNILLARKDLDALQFSLEGKKIDVRTFGLVISIIDFTLSRINTGEDILFLDLSSDPELFGGPKGDKQSETYRKMKEVTDDCWEESFPKTNVLWLQYLVDILLTKKTFDRTSKDERELRSLKKRLNNYDSAKEATSDPFFEDLFVHNVS